MTDRVRRLNKRGIEAFRNFLNRLRAGEAAAPPSSLLANDATTEPFDRTIDIEECEFPTRLEAAQYLHERFGGVAGLEEDVGLWSWLSLYYFDQVCPPATDGARAPGRDYRHILEPGYPAGHRHLLAGPYLVYRLHGDAACLLLCTKVHVENRFHHQLGSRQALITNPAIIDAATALYFDESKGRPKRGSQASDAPGGLLRFVDVIGQLDLNYDLYSMSTEGILQLLPEEFDAWKPRTGARGIVRRLRALVE